MLVDALSIFPHEKCAPARRVVQFRPLIKRLSSGALDIGPDVFVLGAIDGEEFLTHRIRRRFQILQPGKLRVVIELHGRNGGKMQQARLLIVNFCGTRRSFSALLEASEVFIRVLCTDMTQVVFKMRT